MNNYHLRMLMDQEQIDQSTQSTILEIMQECETGIFTDALIPTDRDALLKKTTQSLESLVK